MKRTLRNGLAWISFAATALVPCLSHSSETKPSTKPDVEVLIAPDSVRCSLLESGRLLPAGTELAFPHLILSCGEADAFTTTLAMDLIPFTYEEVMEMDRKEEIHRAIIKARDDHIADLESELEGKTPKPTYWQRPGVVGTAIGTALLAGILAGLAAANQ